MLLGLISFVNLAYGQGKFKEFMTETPPEERAQLQTDYMKETLSLSRDQESKVHGVNLKYAEKTQEAYEAPTKKNQKLKTMKHMNAQKEGELKLILSTEQYDTYERNKEAMKEKIKARIEEKKEEEKYKP